MDTSTPAAPPRPEGQGAGPAALHRHRWYETYSERDGAEGRRVAAYRFSENWDSWEMHPASDAVVICLDGAITLHQEMADGAAATIALGPGDFAINPPSCWHTADVAGAVSALFITAGMGIEPRAR